MEKQQRVLDTSRQSEHYQDKAIWESHNSLTLFPTNHQIYSYKFIKLLNKN